MSALGGILRGLVHRLGLATRDEMAANTALLSEKLDRYAAEIAIRQEAQTRAARAGGAAVHAGVVVATEVDGFILGIPAEEWRLAAYCAFRGTPEPGMTRAFEAAVRPGMTVVDVGAHIGIYTLSAARLAGPGGKVFSFEPAPRSFQLLRDNVQVNGLLESGRIVLDGRAVSDRSGPAALHLYANDSGHNSFYPDGRPAETIHVETVALDEALPPGARVDVVKMDAEGAEPLILRGMRRVIADNPKLVVFLEFAPCHLRRAAASPEAFLEEIAGLGFQALLVDEPGGGLRPAPADELCAAFSVNLRLQRKLA